MVLTIFLAKFLGLYCALFAFALLVRGREALAVIDAMLDDPAAMMLAGVIALAAGLAMVLGHNIWSGGWVTVALTVLGWMMLAKGVALVALPADTLRTLYRGINYAKLFPAYLICLMLFGLVLALAGFLG